MMNLLLILWSLHAQQPLTVERIFQSPELEGVLPQSLQFSPGGKRLTFLQPKKDNFEVLDLWEYDLGTGRPRLLVDSRSLPQENLTEAEKARRERMRITRRGIVEYHWSQNDDRIIFPAGNDLYLYVFGQKFRKLTQTPGAEMDVRFSPKDNFVSFVRDQNLYLIDLAKNKEVPVTTAGKGDLSYGVAEFIAQEEMGRFTGYWWSADENWIAFTETDESPVKWVERYEINDASVVVRKQRYPEAGTHNARVRLGVVKIADLLAGSAQPQWIPLPTGDLYLPRVTWTEDGKVAYQVQSRDQKLLTVNLYDPSTKRSQLVLTEKDTHWINLHDDWRWLKKSQHLIWASERTGHKHLYLVDRQGKLLRTLTKGKWDVDAIEAIDEDAGWIYFTATRKTPLEKHLYRIKFEGDSDREPLTREEGLHAIKMDKNGKHYLDTFSTPSAPPIVSLYRSSGEKIATLSDNALSAQHPLFPFKDSLVAPEFGSFTGPSGTTLYYKVFKPKNFVAQKPHPLIVMGYGGPHNQYVHKGWGGKQSLIAQVLVQKGFVVASFDNRGSARRGRAFENPLYHAFGTVEVADQTAGVKHLVQQGYIDPARVGFFGWSYGGYLSLMLATKSADVFKANVAVAPVTDFSLYDTHYTERYMGKPQDNKTAYARANVLNYASKLKGSVLIIHGMADDNVLFTNTTLLFKKLQEAGIVYESLTYPGAKHGISGRSNQTHVFKSTVDYFERHLKPRE